MKKNHIENMKVLSLFDGVACGRVALERAGITVDRYYASEIDKYAIKIAQKNYPDIVQLGDITKIEYFKSTDIIAFGDNQIAIDGGIDLVIGGSPCQGFSFSGKQLNFNDPRSVLFFEFSRLLKEVKPRYFLLENVRMKQEYQDVISEHLGVKPIAINSSLVSAQNRYRLYWTNIPNITQPEDKGILLKDIIQTGLVDKDKSYCVDANYFKGGNLKQYFEKGRRQLVFEKPHGFNKGGMKLKDKFNTLRSCTNSNYAIYDGKRCIQIGEADLNGHDYIKRVYSIEGKSPTLNANGGGNLEPKINISNTKWRKLTPIECERLQTIEDNYTEGISNSQRYKALGNGWTVDIISHIFKNLK